MCTILNSHPHPIRIRKGQACGVLREAQSNDDNTFPNPWAIHFVENPSKPIKGLPDVWTPGNDQAKRREQNRKENWLME